MTVIVADAGVMAADSGEFAGCRRQPLPAPKITRLPDGGLIACCGAADDSWAFREWAAAGFPVDAKPILTKDEDGFRALHMRPDGSTRIFYSTERHHRTAQPVTIGETTACTFVEGAMAAGASAEKAVQLACERCVWVAGPVQVETIPRLRDIITMGGKRYHAPSTTIVAGDIVYLEPVESGDSAA